MIQEHRIRNSNSLIVVFEERGKLDYPEKSLSEQSSEPTTNSTTHDAGSGNQTQDTLAGSVNPVTTVPSLLYGSR